MSVYIVLPEGSNNYVNVQESNTEEEEIEFVPDSEEEEILQNVKTICKTPKSSVPLDRDFGVDTEAIDKPTPAAMAKIQNEIITAINKYEPRARVESVKFTFTDNSAFNIKVRIALNNAEE